MSLFGRINRIRAAAAVLTLTAGLICGGNTVYADRLRAVDGIVYRCSDSGERKGVYTGWVTRGGSRYYYRKGKMLKNRWLTVNGVKKYRLCEDGKAATGTVKIGDEYYTFDSRGRLSENYEADGTAMPSLSERGIATTGRAPSPEEIKALIDREKVTIASFVRLETPDCRGDINISLSGYNHIQAENNTLALDYITLPVFSENKIIGEVVLFDYEGELHYTASAGGDRWERKNRIFSERPGEKLAFVYVGELTELVIAPDGTVYDLCSGEGASLDYGSYATEYNTFCFSDIISGGNYVTVPAGVSNITLR